jgi:hypothetical protein
LPEGEIGETGRGGHQAAVSPCSMRSFSACGINQIRLRRNPRMRPERKPSRIESSLTPHAVANSSTRCGGGSPGGRLTRLGIFGRPDLLCSQM